MAKTSTTDEVFRRLHAQGVRKRTARLIAEATDRRRKPAKTVQRALDDLIKVVSEVEDRLTGGPAKRSAAARKAAATRRRHAARPGTVTRKATRPRTRAR